MSIEWAIWFARPADQVSDSWGRCRLPDSDEIRVIPPTLLGVTRTSPVDPSVASDVRGSGSQFTAGSDSQAGS